MRSLRTTICVVTLAFLGWQTELTAATINPGEVLRVHFVFSGNFVLLPTADVLLVSDPDVSGFAGAAVSLYNGNTLLGTVVNNTGTLGVRFKSATSQFNVSPNTIVDFGSINDGSIVGRIDISSASILTTLPGFLSTDLFRAPIQAGQWTGTSTLAVARATVLFSEILPAGPIEPSARIETILSNLDSLSSLGVLNQGQSNSLKVKLDDALGQLAQNPQIAIGSLRAANDQKPSLAINRLRSFINQVSSLVSDGVLSAAQGQVLIENARRVIDQLAGRCVDVPVVTAISPTSVKVPPAAGLFNTGTFRLEGQNFQGGQVFTDAPLLLLGESGVSPDGRAIERDFSIGCCAPQPGTWFSVLVSTPCGTSSVRVLINSQ